MQMIIRQVDLDDAVRDLLIKLSEVYNFMNEDKLVEIEKMQVVYGELARQTQECADFIDHYSETKNACEFSALNRHPLIPNVVSFSGTRLRKNVLQDTETEIQKFNDALDKLMQQVRDRVVRITVLNVCRIGNSCPQTHPNLN